MVKITSEKSGVLSVYNCSELEGTFSVGWVEYADWVNVSVSSFGMRSSASLAIDKAQLTELIEMLQQFAEYLEE